eukprot:360993-Amphidinium_carterae.1
MVMHSSDFKSADCMLQQDPIAWQCSSLASKAHFQGSAIRSSANDRTRRILVHQLGFRKVCKVCSGRIQSRRKVAAKTIPYVSLNLLLQN